MPGHLSTHDWVESSAYSNGWSGHFFTHTWSIGLAHESTEHLETQYLVLLSANELVAKHEVTQVLVVF